MVRKKKPGLENQIKADVGIAKRKPKKFTKTTFDKKAVTTLLMALPFSVCYSV